MGNRKVRSCNGVIAALFFIFSSASLCVVMVSVVLVFLDFSILYSCHCVFGSSSSLLYACLVKFLGKKRSNGRRKCLYLKSDTVIRMKSSESLKWPLKNLRLWGCFWLCVSVAAKLQKCNSQKHTNNWPAHGQMFTVAFARVSMFIDWMLFPRRKWSRGRKRLLFRAGCCGASTNNV